MELNFAVDDLGNQLLTDATFEKQQFEDLEIDAPLGRHARIERCAFLDCSTHTGTCAIGSGVTLDRVVISNLACGDALRIASEVEFNEVVIKGRKPSKLIIQPEEEDDFQTRPARPGTFDLDVSGFKGEVEIVGLRGSMVRKDPQRHVTVLSRWKSEVDWKGLGIRDFSYWRIFVQKLSSFGAEEGVFSLPPAKHKHYAVTMTEREVLEKAGLRFD